VTAKIWKQYTAEDRKEDEEKAKAAAAKKAA